MAVVCAGVQESPAGFHHLRHTVGVGMVALHLPLFKEQQKQVVVFKGKICVTRGQWWVGEASNNSPPPILDSSNLGIINRWQQV